MNDAIALLSISQLICIAGIAYLYMQLQAVRRDLPRRRPAAARPVHAQASPEPAAAGQARSRAAQQAYGAARPAQPGLGPSLLARDAAAIAARMGELGVDVPALARRMGKSEEEVRLLLRRKGIAS